MAHFFGTLEGDRGECTRCGTKDSGLRGLIAGNSGAIGVELWHDEETGTDQYSVVLIPDEHSSADVRDLATGELNA